MSEKIDNIYQKRLRTSLSIQTSLNLLGSVIPLSNKDSLVLNQIELRDTPGKII